MRPVFKTLITVALFSIAMGFMESAVVVYLRELYYPAGFTFPIVPVSRIILITELGRELATLIMLLCVGIIAGKNFAERFVFFLFSFALWDIAYYLFLKILLNWPASLFTWDILFLIPVPWAGPVLAPCIISLTMILFFLMVLYLQDKGFVVSFRWFDWMLMTVSSVIFITSFTLDYLEIVLTTAESISSLQMSDRVAQHIPFDYNWGVFFAAESILLTDLFLIFRRSRSKI